MRFLKRQTINRRQLKSTTVYSDITDTNVYVNPRNSGSMVLPSGTDAQIPASPVRGMMRYNVDHNEVQVYQGSAWRNLRFKESSPIVQQNLGAGDYNTVYFGPLNSAYSPANISSNVPLSGGQSAGQFGGQNILVIVENVLQLYNTNYTIEQNPSIGGEVYTAVTSATANVGATTIYFNSAMTITNATGNGATVTLTFAGQPAPVFSVGQSITVSNITPTVYNGVFTVTGVTNNSVSYASTATGTMLFPGDVVANSAVYPATISQSSNLVGSIVTGSSSLQANTAISSFVTDPSTDALISITINKPLITSNMSTSTSLTFTENTQSGSGYYIKFNSPPPYGKIVTALLGFDQ
jgi:hypothetical protein